MMPTTLTQFGDLTSLYNKFGNWTVAIEARCPGYIDAALLWLWQTLYLHIARREWQLDDTEAGGARLVATWRGDHTLIATHIARPHRLYLQLAISLDANALRIADGRRLTLAIPVDIIWHTGVTGHLALQCRGQAE